MLALILILTVIELKILAQNIESCPDGWFEEAGQCYNFIFSPALTYQEAAIFCQKDMTSLVSINSLAEHNFIKTWLHTHDQSRQLWFTSGYRDKTGKLLWESDASDITEMFFSDHDSPDKVYVDPWMNLEYNSIVYKYFESSDEFLWSWSRLMKPGPFVCEVSLSDTWRMYQQQRDFSYGENVTDPEKWETGPNITHQSPDTVFFEIAGKRENVVLDCVASGNPHPQYRWYRKSLDGQTKEWITPDLNAKFVITYGRLIIMNPDPVTDSSIYTCVASNKMGTALSNPIEVTYGYIAEFPNVKTNFIDAILYMGIEIGCQTPAHNTELQYNWYKSNVNFIRTDLNSQYFLSRNGRFYISEVQAADQGEYFCMVFMDAGSGKVLAESQAPSRTSMGIDLRVIGGNANTYGPEIQDRFPQYFPAVPMVGEWVEIECLAYGRMPLYYSWVREDAPLNPRSYLKDHNRVLVLPRARLEDTGTYTCLVQGQTNKANKTIHLSLKARPYFPYPLRHQHLDAGSSFKWTCNAVGVPKPTYTWYKNGVVLTSDPAIGLTVRRNILTIDKVEADHHNGVYQCEATNSYGRARSTAQIRTLAFAPTFVSTPLAKTKQATEGGNITIACTPQAAPRAHITWLRNGVELDAVLPSGALRLVGVSKADSGTYTCVAVNDLGEARASCELTIFGQTVFLEEPSDVVVEQNQTAVLQCRASFAKGSMDIVYTWAFYSHVLDLTGNSEDRVHYTMPFYNNLESGTLYIVGAQLKHSGLYTCQVSTVTGSISASAYVTVRGPPGEPAGVHVRQSNVTQLRHDNVEIWWQDGDYHGYLTTHYAIEFRTTYDEDWTLLRDDITTHETKVPEHPDWHGFVITEGLSPGNGYQFRMRAGNHQIGFGPVSSGPYKWYTVVTSAPIYAPTNIGGGGGFEGQLIISWEALPRSHWGGDNLRYQVYYRRKLDNDLNKKWEMSEEVTESVFYTLVGVQNYFFPYEVKVQAINDKGRGPNSTIGIVYSAEALPTRIPTFVSAKPINSTASIVTWERIPITREDSKGVPFAYVVNYWFEGNLRCPGKYEDSGISNNFYGDVTTGLLVGLEPAGDYCLNLQFINNAGLGPKSDNYGMPMPLAPPQRYPEYITVMSHGPESVRVEWKGVYAAIREEAIRGYKAWWWNAQEDINQANISTFGLLTTGVIHGIRKDVIYRMRMFSYSVGGDGRKGPDVFFTLGGMVQYDPLTSEIMNSAPGISLRHLPSLLFLHVFFSALRPT
ncbi:contactin-3-like [Physella acuta]|uniref:contactin-3-like n=1 Tax=Physella acuta TaxID=109671 RepID=UPI0027DBED33|nr:contactin-3-like [Physella acuta]